MKWYEKAMGLAFRGICTVVDRGAVERYIRQGPNDVLTIKDADYAGRGDPAQMLDIILPEDSPAEASYPIVVYIHGGGWSYGSKELMSGFCNRVASKGYVVFNISYRLAPEYEHPAQLFDVLRAVEWTYQNGAQYHGDTTRIFLAGDSAGAHLASLAAAYFTNPALVKRAGLRPLRVPKEAFVGNLLFCGAYKPLRLNAKDKSTVQLNTFVDTSDSRPVSRAENLTAIGNMTEDYPPCFLSSGKADILHSFHHTDVMMKALAEAGIACEAHIYEKKEYPDAYHEFQMQDGPQCAAECREALWEFMNRITSGI